MRHQYNFYLQWEREKGREKGRRERGGCRNRLKDREHIQTGGRMDRRTNEQTDIHTQISIKGWSATMPFVIFNIKKIKNNLIKGNSPTEEFLIYIFEIKHGVLTESNNKATWYKRIWIRWIELFEHHFHCVKNWQDLEPFHQLH